MIDTDKRQFQEIVLATAELYSTVKKIEVTPIMLKLFFSSLREFTIEQVSFGFEQHLADPIDGKFFPKPANIIKHLKPKELTAEEKGELAWAQIEREIRATGSYGKLELDDKQGLAALKSFTSWKDLCSMDISKLTWAKKEFLSMYSTYENTPLEMLPSSLPGRVELVEHKQQDVKSMANILEGIKQHRLKGE
jgi:hypothetical protein